MLDHHWCDLWNLGYLMMYWYLIDLSIEGLLTGTIRLDYPSPRLNPSWSDSNP